MYARRWIVNLKKTQRVTEACANSPPRIRRIPHRESADFLTANSPTSPPRIPYREFADLSLSLANIDQWIRGESMANVRPIICVIGEYHSSRIRRIKFVWIRGEYSPRKFQMNSIVRRFPGYFFRSFYVLHKRINIYATCRAYGEHGHAARGDHKVFAIHLVEQLLTPGLHRTTPWPERQPVPACRRLISTSVVTPRWPMVSLSDRDRPSKHEMLTQCWVNVGPPSKTVGQH